MTGVYKKVLSLLLILLILTGLLAIGEGFLTAYATTGQDIVNYVKAQENNYYEYFACLRYAEEVYQHFGAPRPYDCCAHKSADRWIVSTSRDIPLGAAVYFNNTNGSCDYCGRNIGHVGIYIGNGNFISVIDSSIQKRNMNDSNLVWNSSYMGYGWIGGTSFNQQPNGYVDNLSGGNGTIYVRGWAYDPDEPSKSINIHVYIGGPAGSSGAECKDLGATNAYRPDVSAGGNNYHGFEATITTSKTGSQAVYIYALDSQYNDNPCIGSGTVTISYDNTKPSGSISSTNGVSASQTATLSLSDNVNLAGYWWGTNSSYSNNTYTTVSGTSKSVTKTISASGTYYLTVKDAAGNISSTVNKTFYKTTLNGNGGTSSPASVITMSGNSFALPTPTRSGYTITKWNTQSDGSGTGYAAGASFKPTGNTTLYAQWKDSAKPSASISSTNNVASSQTVTLTMSDNVSLAGYYWGTNSTYTSNTYTAISGTSKSITKTVSSAGTYYLTVKDSAGNISSTVSKHFYRTTLNANGGSVSPSNVITMSGNSFNLPAGTRAEHRHSGFNTKANGSGTSYSAGASFKPTGNTTLYATWIDLGPQITITPANSFGNKIKITMTDDKGLVYYYSGTSSNYLDNSKTDLSGTEQTIYLDVEPFFYGKDDELNLYITAVDTDGYVRTTTKEFYKVWVYVGHGYGAQTVMSGCSMDMSVFNVPEKEGYTFLGWNTKKDYSGTLYSPTSQFTPTENGVTLYYQWSENNIPTGEIKQNKSKLEYESALVYGNKITLSLKDDTGIDGYYWGTSSSYSSNPYIKLSASDSVSKSETIDITIPQKGTYYLTVKDLSGNLSATVSASFYETVIDYNDGSNKTYTFITMEGETYCIDEWLYVKLPDIYGISRYTYSASFTTDYDYSTQAGYVASGLNTASDGSGISYCTMNIYQYERTGFSEDDDVVGGSGYTSVEDTTLYIEWIQQRFSVTYNGYGAGFKQPKIPGTDITLRTDIPVYKDHDFIAWRDSNGNEYQPGDLYTIDSDLVLFAKWKDIIYYNVIFDANGGNINGNNSASLICGAEHEVPEKFIPKRNNYDFAGWKELDNETGELIDFAGIMPDHDITLVAHWEPTVYTATFYIDDEPVSIQQYTIESESLTEPDIPPKPYTLSAKWEEYNLSKGGDLVLYPVYESPKLDVNPKVNLIVGDNYKITVRSNFNAERTVYKSSDNNVATVDNSGYVNVKNTGTCTIYITRYGKDSLGNEIKARGITTINVVGNNPIVSENPADARKIRFENFLLKLIINFSESLKKLGLYLTQVR